MHWNFFFTLAAVSVLSSIINVHPQYCGILGSSILIGIPPIGLIYVSLMDSLKKCLIFHSSSRVPDMLVVWAK